MEKNIFLLTCVFMLMFFCGCAITNRVIETQFISFPDIIIASYSETPVIIDGNLDDPVWQKTPFYNFSLPGEKSRQKNSDAEKNTASPREQGELRVAWNEKYLYIAAKLYDSDIVQECEENQKHLYSTGDTIEIFLKPENNTWYWEIYGTPNKKKTIFWYPGRGRQGLPSGFEPGIDPEIIHIDTQIKGTLNNWQDKDEYWTIEIAIPVKELTKLGDEFGKDGSWRILMGRYNYSRYIPLRELSTIPQLSKMNFHLLEEYGILQFEK
ncbi:MAG: carbohydrate-binding family 9-like protein [Candidatus Omnitrophica bacterium]|nr:carbohydrate-binding family 9-like protein [Candidatus Omnitrophota bacterium]